MSPFIKIICWTIQLSVSFKRTTRDEGWISSKIGRFGIVDFVFQNLVGKRNKEFPFYLFFKNPPNFRISPGFGLLSLTRTSFYCMKKASYLPTVFVLGMKMWSLTQEKKEEILKQRDNKQQELKNLQVFFFEQLMFSFFAFLQNFFKIVYCNHHVLCKVVF